MLLVFRRVEDHKRGFCDDEKVSMLRRRLDLCLDLRRTLCFLACAAQLILRPALDAANRLKFIVHAAETNLGGEE